MAKKSEIKKQKKGAGPVAVAKKGRPADRDSSDINANAASSSDNQISMDFSYESVINSGARTYKSNCHINILEKLIDFSISKDNFEEKVKYYYKVGCIYHQNVVRLEEVLMEGDCLTLQYLTAVKDGSDDIFAPVSSLLYTAFFTPEDFYDSSSNRNFKKFIRDVTNGLVETQKHDIFHGNLSVESIFYYRRARATEPLFKLGNFEYRCGDKEKLMLRDWSDLACLIEAYMEERIPKWSDKRLNVELRHLLDSLKRGDFGFDPDWTRLLKMSHMCELIQQFIMSHPAMLECEERPSYVLASVAYLDKKKMMHRIKDSDVMFEGKELTIDGQILDRLILMGGIPKDIKLIKDGEKGLYYVKMVRNQFGHQPHNKDPVLAKVMGKTSLEVDEYFRREQPNVILALYKAVRGTTFKFVGFHSL